MPFALCVTIEEEEKAMPSSKILVVDDDYDLVQIMEFQLKKKGYEVLTASNGEEGLEKAFVQLPDLIMLDVKMPKMDGYTFIRRLKKDARTKNTPLIVLTSYEPMKDMFQMEGVKDFFVKTADMQKLLATIEERLKISPASGS